MDKILTIADLEAILSQWPPETLVKINYETHANRTINTVVGVNGTVFIVAENN